MTWKEFQALPGTMEVARLLGENDSKCAVIGYYRGQTMLDAVRADLQRKYPEK